MLQHPAPQTVPTNAAALIDLCIITRRLCTGAALHQDFLRRLLGSQEVYSKPNRLS